MLFTLGRILYALPFGVFGLNHFMYAQMMKGMVPPYFPGGIFWIYLTGAAHLAACISILAMKWTRWSGILLAVMLGVFIVTMHIPALSNPQMMQMAMINLLKDTALAGGALMIASCCGECEEEKCCKEKK